MSAGSVGSAASAGASALPTLEAAMLAGIRTRVAGALPGLVRAALEPMAEAEVWAAPREGMNAPGVLVRHCAGALRYFIAARIGGGSHVRDRGDEFTAHPAMSKAELIADFDAAVAEVAATLDGIAPDALAGPSRDVEGRYALLGEDLLAATVHLAVHAGQLLQLARLNGHAMGDDLWGRVHRASGAMKAPPAA
jgi:hypothetical protein